ncbi:MAG: hypothetical protein HND54_11770 [Bacteroidetes bacterium]|nr:hypothetical protein [Bacteroidota bacterium]
MDNRFPNLLIIGAMKSGTTSLHDYLNKHPDVFMSEPKEIHYYATNSKMAKEEYLELFQSEKKIVGTSPQSYTKCHNKYYKDIPERIYKDTPHVKLIYIVRDPIERYKSHILESFHCDPIEDIEYSKSSGNYIKTSMYGLQLKAYLEFFDLSQIHILSLEDLNAKPLEEMNKLFDFLGIDQMKEAHLFQTKKNTAESKNIPRIIKSHFLYRIGKRINRRITQKIAERLAFRFFKEQLTKPQLYENEISDLKNYLKGDIDEFRRITGKKFEQWCI